MKQKGNDELRQRFINLTVPQASAIGLTIPDPLMTQDEKTGDWISGPIDWDEFHQVITGNGPCNRPTPRAPGSATRQPGMPPSITRGPPRDHP